VIHPATGEALPDLVLIVAGPDSDVQRRARLKLADDLLEYRLHVPADDRERLEIEFFARCVIGWRFKEGGQELPFSHSAVVRVLRQHRYIREQLEAFAASRTAYFAKTPFEEAA
jgi:hypothetical protein